ncbi:MAG: DUF3995 domain-containing protein [Ktedonobacteraceae bacterium]|nr:DUF3995 domain-containing protein [Ktedonobacteraceae bacterium]MBO0790472.1 DUF3995 domain-containing protein [Ktedonobacteraceae bacterium]
MDEQIKAFAGILIAVVFALDGLLHLYWATGRVWPASDQLSLIQLVLNSNKTRLLRPRTLVSIAGILFLGALTALARVHRLGVLGQLMPEPLLQLGILVIATGLLLRGLAGIGWVFGWLAAKSALFYRLNLLVYTPLCLVLFVAAVAAARF